MMTTQEAAAFLDEHRVRRVRVQGIQHDGLLVGKVLSPQAFLDIATTGIGIADYTFGTDRVGEPAVGFTAPWRSTVIGDVHLVPDLDTLRLDAATEGLAVVLANATDIDGEPLPICGRSLVSRLSADLANRGIFTRFAFEIEGQFFDGSFGENHAANYAELRPFGVPSHLPYLAQDMHRLDPIMSEVCHRLDALGVPWEAWNAEAAAGQFELNLAPDTALNAADHVVVVRQVCKEVAYEQDLSVTFMARITPDYGNGLHIHHSLVGEDGPLVFDDGRPHNLSETATHWLGGLMATLEGTASFMAPTPNSFRRVEGFKAVPTHATWDFDNKSAAVRVLARSRSSARFEQRMGAGDMHPHMGAAALLAGGIAGLDEQLQPPERFTKMAWGLPDGDDYPTSLPRSITQAAEALSADKRLRRVLGDDLVDYWIGLRRAEWLSFHTTGGDITAEGPTAWELARYFETL